MSGTDSVHHPAYALAMQSPVLPKRIVLSAYALATPCPVLTSRIVLPATPRRMTSGRLSTSTRSVSAPNLPWNPPNRTRTCTVLERSSLLQNCPPNP
eukprot:2164523-Rhodomonas_salina.2